MRAAWIPCRVESRTSHYYLTEPSLAYEKIRYEVADDGVATITLDDPRRATRSATRCWRELIEAFEAARDDDDGALRGAHLLAREGVLRRRQPGPVRRRRAARCTSTSAPSASRALFRLIGQLGKPTICAANGHVLAGSLGLALACDLIVAKDTAGFGTPEINVGVFPFMIMALIYRNVPRKKTNELLLLGERLTAEEALRGGHREQGRARRGVRRRGGRVGRASSPSKSPVMMKLGKDAMYRQMDMPFDDALDFLRRKLSLALTTEDIEEGVTAFFEKREPEWTGR